MRRGLIALAALVAVGLGLGLWRLAEPEPGTVPETTARSSVATPVPPLPPEAPPIRTRAGEISGQVLAANGEPAAEVGVDVIFAARPALPAACAGILDGCACGDDLEEVLAALDLAFSPIAHATTSADGH